MSSPDFYFAVNATARHLHDEYGMDVLVDYWRSLAREFYAERIANWRKRGVRGIAEDWRAYFLAEPGAEVRVAADENSVTLDIDVCPAIKHLQDCGREIVPYYCDHCDHTCGAMAAAAGFRFERTGGMGTCQQKFVRVADGSSARRGT